VPTSLTEDTLASSTDSLPMISGKSLYGPVLLLPQKTRLIARGALNVGCCGFPNRQREYYRLFPVVELQSTFYNLPQARTAERWRAEAPVGFRFCLKAWQTITHPATSPTWKRSTDRELPGNRTEYGQLRPTRENFDAWERTLKICNILRASICVIQCPPSFKFSGKNFSNARRFLGQIDRGGTKLAWEPRGNWKEHPNEVKRLCNQLDLIHVVDALKSEPAAETETCYFRLHGLGSQEVNYRYRYSLQDLQQLRERTHEPLTRGAKEVFVLFNNQSMLDDARTFCNIMQESSGKSLAE
jgi:uncharacterized protein YecE (DUF72 family)